MAKLAQARIEQAKAESAKLLEELANSATKEKVKTLLDLNKKKTAIAGCS